jgi:hypothetical protein
VFIRSLIFSACCLIGAAPAAHAQGSAVDQTPLDGVLPDASIEAGFRKYTPPSSDLSALYSWDAHMNLTLTAFRRGAGAVKFRSLFQTAGTENIGSRVSVGGTGYVLGLGYTHTYSPDFLLSGGLLHLSSHLTRDLDEKLEEIRIEGGSVPDVADPSEYNVFFIGIYRRFSTWRFTPEIELVVEPVNFHFNGRPAGGVRPVYLGSRWTLWRGSRKSIVARSQHEIGPGYFNYFSLTFQLDGRSQPEGRLQIFVGASPGDQLHVSPNIGALRDGIAVGLRMAFGA